MPERNDTATEWDMGYGEIPGYADCPDIMGVCPKCKRLKPSPEFPARKDETGRVWIAKHCRSCRAN